MGKNINDKLILHTDSSCATAEAVRCLRTNILFLNKGEHIKAIALTSSFPGEGKSFLAANLGVATAQSNKKTLLIDCDIRKQGLSNIFGIDKSHGLCDVLVKKEENLLIDNIPILSTGIDNLSLIPSGLYATNPAELLSSPVLENIIVKARENFDIILLDVPPVLSVTDPLIVAQKADALLFVVAAHAANKKAVARAYSILKGANLKIIGTVLNRADAGAGGYYRYKYKYGGDHGYYYGKNKK